MPRLKPLLSFLVCALLVGCGSVAGSNGQATKRMSKAESKKAMQEFATLFQGAKAGDASSINMGFKPTTELVIRTKDLFVEKAKSERIYNDEIAALNLEKVIDTKNLSTPEGRAKMLKAFEEAERLDSKSLEDAAAFLDKFMEVFNEYGITVPPEKLEEMKGDNTRILAAGTQLWDAWRSLVAHCGQAKPTWDGELLQFEKDSEIETYDSLAEAVDDAGVNFETVSQEVLSRRQRSMAESFSGLEAIAAEE